MALPKELGTIECNTCHGACFVDCESCGGDGTIECINCGGMGVIGEEEVEGEEANEVDYEYDQVMG